MGDRLLRESIKYSRKIDALSCFQESMFYRLMVTVDDFGRFYADPMLLKSALFPVKEDLTKASIVDAIEKLSKAGLIKVYEVGGESYLEIEGWSKEQRTRAKESKFPGIPK